MEALSAIASIVAVAGAGAKLSIVIFEFASTVSSAGQEIKQIGIEISLFCSVLKQLQSTLTKAKARRYSMSAIATIAEILGQCQEIFNAIEEIVTGLNSGNQNVEHSAESTRKWISNVKWTFKRSKVHLLRTTLESCKVTMHIMLSTLEFGQKVASRRVSTIETEEEDKREEMMTRSLMIAHQCTVDTLQRLEDEVLGEQQSTERDTLSPPLTPRTPLWVRIIRRQPKHNPSRSLDNQNPRFPTSTKDLASKRASVWINNLIFDSSPLPVGFRRQTWSDAECARFLDQQAYYFLRKWTDQGEHFAQLRCNSIENALRNGSQEDAPREEDKETVHINDEHVLKPVASSQTGTKQRDLSPDAYEPSSIPGAPITELLLDVDTTHTTNDQVSEPIVDIFQSLQVSITDPCYRLLTAALQKYNIEEPWEQFKLLIVYEDEEVGLGLDEKPLMIFKKLLKAGKEPMFMLRKIVNS